MCIKTFCEKIMSKIKSCSNNSQQCSMEDNSCNIKCSEKNECAKKKCCPIRKAFCVLWHIFTLVSCFIVKIVELFAKLVGYFVVTVLILCLTLIAIAYFDAPREKCKKFKESAFHEMSKSFNSGSNMSKMIKEGNLSCTESKSVTFKDKDKKIKVKKYSTSCKDKAGIVVYQSDYTKEKIVNDKED